MTSKLDRVDWVPPLREVLVALDDHWRFITSAQVRLRRQTAAAGLARCRALLEGICILLEAGRRDVVGVLARALAEAWLVSLYVLYKAKDLDDDSVLLEIFEAYAHWAFKMVQKGGLPEEALAKARGFRQEIAEQKGVDEKSLKLRDLNLADVARELGPILRESGVAPFEPTTVYDGLIRFESLHGVHAGIGTFQLYMQINPGNELSLLLVPTLPVRSEVFAGILTMHLARNIYKVFGVKPSDRFLAIEQRLDELVKACEGTASEGRPDSSPP